MKKTKKRLPQTGKKIHGELKERGKAGKLVDIGKRL